MNNYSTETRRKFYEIIESDNDNAIPDIFDMVFSQLTETQLDNINRLLKDYNKPNNIKAINFLGKYSQHKPLFDEVVKTLDFLDDLKKKEENNNG